MKLIPGSEVFADRCCASHSDPVGAPLSKEAPLVIGAGSHHSAASDPQRWRAAEQVAGVPSCEFAIRCPDAPGGISRIKRATHQAALILERPRFSSPIFVQSKTGRGRGCARRQPGWLRSCQPSKGHPTGATSATFPTLARAKMSQDLALERTDLFRVPPRTAVRLLVVKVRVFIKAFGRPVLAKPDTDRSRRVAS